MSLEGLFDGFTLEALASRRPRPKGPTPRHWNEQRIVAAAPHEGSAVFSSGETNERAKARQL